MNVIVFVAATLYVLSGLFKGKWDWFNMICYGRLRRFYSIWYLLRRWLLGWKWRKPRMWMYSHTCHCVFTSIFSRYVDRFVFLDSYKMIIFASAIGFDNRLLDAFCRSNQITTITIERHKQFARVVYVNYTAWVEYLCSLSRAVVGLVGSSM